MNTTVNALKNLYEAAGGEEATVENVNRIPDMIDALAEIATPFIQEADEGKVVQNGALVAQTSKNITENGTHDTTANNQVVVNVQGNPNSIETITGTLANPWGGKLDEIKAGFANKSLSVFLKPKNLVTYILTDVDVDAIYFSSWFDDNINNFVNMSSSVVYLLGYTIDGELKAHSIWFGASWDVKTINQTLGATETTLTIVHHPMPTT